MEQTFSPQLGPFYETHGQEIIPSGFEEAIERMADTIGDFNVRSNLAGLPDIVAIGHYELTKYIQKEWDRLTKPKDAEVDFPRRGFLLSSKSSSQAAGRAAEEIVLAQLLWRLRLGSDCAEKVFWFYDALDSGLVVKPKGIGSDDYLVRMKSGKLLLFEVKASFKGEPIRFVKKAAQQLTATISVNPDICQSGVALIDLTRKTIRMIVVSSEPIESLESRIRSEILMLEGE